MSIFALSRSCLSSLRSVIVVYSFECGMVCCMNEGESHPPMRGGEFHPLPAMQASELLYNHNNKSSHPNPREIDGAESRRPRTETPRVLGRGVERRVLPKTGKFGHGGSNRTAPVLKDLPVRHSLHLLVSGEGG